MTCYSPSRHYLTAGLVAVGLAVFSGWVAWNWTPAYVAASLFLATAAILIVLALQPAIEIYEHHLAIGKRIIPWNEILRLDRTSWISPLRVHLTLTDDRRVTLLYAGDIDSGKSLLRHLRRCAKDALIDGIPYKQFWGELLSGTSGDRRQIPPPRYPLLRAEDEAEVERMFQRLKTVGNLEPKSGQDEK
jgi:hypothetical protein